MDIGNVFYLKMMANSDAPVRSRDVTPVDRVPSSEPFAQPQMNRPGLDNDDAVNIRFSSNNAGREAESYSAQGKRTDPEPAAQPHIPAAVTEKADEERDTSDAAPVIRHAEPRPDKGSLLSLRA